MLLAAILAAHAAALVYNAWRFAPTLNEPTRVAAGLAIWYRADFQLDIDNPPLIKILAAWPAALVEAEPPLPNAPFSERAARQFLYLNGQRAFTYIFWGRLVCILFSLFGAWICYRWASELYGPRAGLGAMVLWCTCPHVLGYGWTMVADVPAAALLAGAWRSYQRALREDRISAWLAPSVWLGTALVVKFTSLLLLPLYGLAWLWQMAVGRRPARERSAPDGGPAAAEGGPRHAAARGRAWLVPTAGLALLACTGLAFIWAIYLFQGWGQPLHKLRAQASRRALIPLEKRDEAERREFAPETWWEKLPVPLPQDYVMSLYSLKRIHGSPRATYLAGKRWDNPPWYFYLYGLACKTPEGTFVLFGLALACGVWGGVSFKRDLWVLLPALWLLAMLAVGRGTIMHLRYAIPVLPFLLVWGSRVLSAGRAWQWAGSLAIAVAAAGSLSQYPHSLAYFNVVSGGPSQGHRHLLDSSLDWGQDLFELVRWVKAHPEAADIKIAYSGILHPGQAGFRSRVPPILTPPKAGEAEGRAQPAEAAEDAAEPSRKKAREPDTRPSASDREKDADHAWAEPGWYAVSVNCMMAEDGAIMDSTSRLHYLDEGNLTYFQLFEPVARAGRSILIYHLTADDWQRLIAQGWRPVEVP